MLGREKAESSASTDISEPSVDGDAALLRELLQTSLSAENIDELVVWTLTHDEDEAAATPPPPATRPTTATPPRKKRSPDRRPYGAAVVLDGGCRHCQTASTPQWRYVHKEKFCNACYMRLKRWAHSQQGLRRLPPRARLDLSAREDQILTQQAHEIITLAVEHIGH